MMTTMTPLQSLEDLHLYDAVSDLHHVLSEWAHTANPPEFVVRRLLTDRNDITVDIVGAPKRGLDRFVVRLGKENLTAMAGTLGVEREGRVWPRSSFRLKDLQSWLRDTVGTCDLCN